MSQDAALLVIAAFLALIITDMVTAFAFGRCVIPGMKCSACRAGRGHG